MTSKETLVCVVAVSGEAAREGKDSTKLETSDGFVSGKEALRAVAVGRQDGPPSTRHVAIYLYDLVGGGVERAMLVLAGALALRGFRVDLVLCRVEGPMLAQVPEGVNIFPLSRSFAGLGRAVPLAADPEGFAVVLRPVLLSSRPSQTLRYLPALVRYLRRERPGTLISAKPYPNLEALWARRLSAAPTRVAVTEHGNISLYIKKNRTWKRRFLAPLLRRLYPEADAIIAVSDAVADDLFATTGIPRDRITTIYNPVVDTDLLDKARRTPDHPWFASDGPPVLLSAGHLGEEKDFATLIRAFARVRASRPARLIILGEARNPRKDGPRRAALMALAAELSVADDVALPGFVDNPFAYMARAKVFVLSSVREGFGNVLVEAMACGCPVVSTACPGGPAEILAHGAYGTLVPVGDDAALAKAITATLDAPPDPELLKGRAAAFSPERAVERYLELFEGAGTRPRSG